jgi:hypothetical protein
MPRGVPCHRVVLTALLSVCLLFLQQENALHALVHIGAQLERSKHSAIERPVGDTCLECELLAAGTAAAATSPPATFADVATRVDIVVPAVRATIGAPASYQSRAPPHILQLA